MPSDSTEFVRKKRGAEREAKREKQREASHYRALKMRAARLQWELQSAEENDRPAIVSAKPGYHVGCSGWFYWHWQKGFYPAHLPTNKWFQHYAGRFRTVELNAPFYSWPTVAAVKSWIRQAERRKIIYTVKVSELITHLKQFSGTATLVKDFGYIADVLGPRMGCFLFQLPPSFRYSPARLKCILTQLNPGRRNVVEFRHPSWWNDHVYRAFRAAGTIFCSCSGPWPPDELVRTADDVYIRFHGIKKWYFHDYSAAELKIWADRIRASDARGVWAYFNNDRGGYSTQNAATFLRMLRR